MTGDAGSKGVALRSQALHFPSLLEEPADGDVKSCAFFANCFPFLLSSVTKATEGT